MLQIKIANLKPGIHRFELKPDAEALDLDPSKFENIRVDAQLDYHEERILVRLAARADATLECDRTLEEFSQPLQGEHSILFAPLDVAEAAAAQFEDVRALQPGDQEIDITEAVRDTLLLAIPARCIAPGAEEREIPTEFGKPDGEQGAIDPRWEALRKLKIDDDAA